MSDEYLPDVYESFRARFPDLSRVLDELGAEAESAGPLDDRTRRLVKLGIAVGAVSEGAVRSNTRKALALGVTESEIQQVAALAINTRGFPAAIAAFSWMLEVFAAESANRIDG
jgi:alkylhydroperoxidase/carboxymuconolactone decarboxylase family protein YurZ